MAEAMILDTEAAVMANFEFLTQSDIDVEAEGDEDEDDMYERNTESKSNQVK